MGYQYDYLTKEQFWRVATHNVPSIVLSYAYGNPLSRLITRVSNRWRRNKHEYSHAMALVDPGVLASQGVLFAKEPLEEFLDSHTRLKIWVYEGWSIKDMRRIREAMRRDLGKPWWTRVYDAPGLVGQWLGNTLGFGRFVNLPVLHYCSSRVMKHFGGWLPGLWGQASPADIDRFCTHCGEWVCKGVYDPKKESDDA